MCILRVNTVYFLIFREKEQDTGDEEVVEENEGEDENGEAKEKKDTGQQGPWNVKSTPAPTTTTPGMCGVFQIGVLTFTIHWAYSADNMIFCSFFFSRK